MKKTIFFKISLLTAIYLAVFFMPNIASSATFNIQTNSATNIYSNQAVLNGLLTNFSSNSIINVWFEWGTDTTFNNQSSGQEINYSSSFSKNITGLLPNTTYYFRAVGQSIYGEKIYGQQMTFYTGNTALTGNLTVSKKVINLTTSNLIWQNSVSAKPFDIISFVITLQTGNQQINNIFVKDVLPQNLIYKGNLTLNASLNSSENPTSGISIATMQPNSVYVISYQAQVAGENNFSYGTTTLNNTVIVTNNQTPSQTVSSQVLVNKSFVSGATYVPTGFTNNFIKDFFFLPLFIIISLLWLYFSGNIYKFTDWIKK